MNVRHHVAALAVVALLLLAGTPLAWAQTPFPQVIHDSAGEIVVYQPQPETIIGNVMTGRAAMSLKTKSKGVPIFGAFLVHIDHRHGRGEGSQRDARSPCHQGPLAGLEGG